MYRDETKNLVNFAKNVNWELFEDGVISFSQIALTSSSISMVNNNCTVLDDTILRAISDKYSLCYEINFRFYSNAFPSGITNNKFSVFLPYVLSINNINYKSSIISAWYDASDIPSNTGYNQVLYPDLATANSIAYRTLNKQSINLTGDILGGMQFTALYSIQRFSDALI